MKLIPLVTAVAVAQLAGTAVADKAPYSLDDLTTLVSQKSYKEAVDHLTDIAPSKRDKAWLTVATDAATGYIAALENDDLVRQVLEIERIDGAIPALLKSKKYTAARAKIGLKGFKACFAHPYAHQECFEHGIKFVDADPTNATLALQMAKLVRRHTSPHGAVAPYFKRALAAAGKNAASVCKDPDMKLVVVSGFNLPDTYDDAKTIRTIVTKSCWRQFKTVVAKEFLAHGDTSYERRNTCKILQARNALTGDQTRKCAKAFAD